MGELLVSGSVDNQVYHGLPIHPRLFPCRVAPGTLRREMICQGNTTKEYLRESSRNDCIRIPKGMPKGILRLMS